MMKRGVFILFLTCLGILLQAQSEKIQWTSMSAALERAEEENKKIFIDLYTKWCGWCKKMDKATFQQPDIAAYINRHFIPVKFDAEQRSEIVYKGESYKYVRSGRKGYHELAAELSKNLGRLTYPTIIFLDEEQEVIQPIPGFLDPATFEIIMHYIAEDHFRNKPYKTFSASFISQRD